VGGVLWWTGCGVVGGVVVSAEGVGGAVGL